MKLQNKVWHGVLYAALISGVAVVPATAQIAGNSNSAAVAESGPGAMNPQLAGAKIPAELLTRLDTNATTRVGEQVRAKSLKAVRVNGEDVLPSGSMLYGRVTEVMPKQAGQPAALAVTFDRAVAPDGKTYALQAGIAELVPPNTDIDAYSNLPKPPGGVTIAANSATGTGMLTSRKGNFDLHRGVHIVLQNAQ